jgi:hypothetical protein
LLYYPPTGRYDLGRPRRKWLNIPVWNRLASSFLSDENEEDNYGSGK